MSQSQPRIVVLMGVQCVGKTFIGEKLAQHLSWNFTEPDRAHPPANVEKMRAGLPLTDADRQPWLETLASYIKEWHARGESHIMACSALKKQYRDILRVAPINFVYLKASKETIAQRCDIREHEYMPSTLLDSQLAALEEPSAEEALIIDAAAKPEVIVEQIVQQLSLGQPIPTA